MHKICGRSCKHTSFWTHFGNSKHSKVIKTDSPKVSFTVFPPTQFRLARSHARHEHATKPKPISRLGVYSPQSPIHIPQIQMDGPRTDPATLQRDTTTESKYCSQTEIFNNLGCDSHPFSISIQVVTTEMLLLNEAMFLCLAIAAADIAAIAAKEGIAKDIGMATPLAIKFQFFVCGVAVGVASTMVVGLIKANDKEKPKPKPQPEPQPEPKPTTKKTTIVDVVYVFPKGRCYHSPKCTSSQPEKNDKLQEPTEMTLTEAKQMKKVECRCIACNEFFRSST